MGSRLTAVTTNPPLINPLARLFKDDLVYTTAGIFTALSLVPTMLAMGLDSRVFEGQIPRIKPVKFQFALSTYMLTLAFFARLLPEGFATRPIMRAYAILVVVCLPGELLWIGNGAHLAEGSHFNISTPVMAALYGLMGVFAVILTSASVVYGIAIPRHGAHRLSRTICCH